MRMLFLSLLCVFPAPCFAQQQQQLELPSLRVFNYQSAARDPFISAAAKSTLLERGDEVRGPFSGDIVRQYLDTVVKVIRENISCGGVSIADDPRASATLINGYAFRVGDSIPVPATRKELAQLEQLAQSYGLPIERNEDGKLNLLVGQITDRGVDLVLPGLKTTVLLPLKHETETTSIPLEELIKKKPK
jgi:hypothetical protein